MTTTPRTIEEFERGSSPRAEDLKILAMPLFEQSYTLPIAKTNDQKIVLETLTSVLPEGVPPSFREIAAVRSEGNGRSKVITADLLMIDFLPATVVLRRWEWGWSHRYENLPGGALCWEGGCWARTPDGTEDLDKTGMAAG